MATADEIMQGLEPAFRAEAQAVIDRLKAERHVRVVPVSGVRDPWTQAIYWRQSRTGTVVSQKIAFLADQGAPFLAEVLEEVGPHSGPHVTDAVPGTSFHQYARALDVYIESPATHKALWRDPKTDGVEFNLAVQLYDQYGAAAEARGLTWGGHWSFGDFGHIQSQKASTPLQEYGGWPGVDAEMRRIVDERPRR